MQKISIKLLAIQLPVFLFLFFVSCSKYPNHTIIEGEIYNLPDGTLYLYKDDPSNKVDSVKTINGMFEIHHQWNEREPVYIGIDHVDEKGVLRFFSFKTNAKYKGAGWGTSVFLSDPIIKIKGNLKYDTLVGIQLPPDKKPVTGPPLVGGKQTEAFYNIDGDLFEKIDNKTVEIINEKLKKYPYSYHLLYKISENKNSFSPQQIDEFLKSFKGEITKSDTYQKLATYNKKRFNEKSLSLPLLEDSNGVRKEILNKNYKKHLVIFWASWCGPCRQEMPLLKKVYSESNKEIEFVSVSIDKDKKSWQEALNIEKMDWKQLIVNEKNKTDFESIQIHFKLNQAIPYTVLVDNNMNVLAFSTGLSDEIELRKMVKK